MECTLPVSASAIGTTLGALKKPLEDLYELAKREGKEFFVAKANAARLNRLRTELRKVEIVKTLWSMDKGISLFDFYYPQTVEWDGKTKARLSDLDELPLDNNYLIEGIVGQGKSIFLRYLCCQEMRKRENTRIPIFVELRFIDAGHSLQDLIFDGFHKLGFKISDDLLSTYAKTGRFVLLLDAFDEVDEKESTAVVKYLDTLSAAYPSLQIVVTSRPESSIRGLSLFRVVKLQPLDARDLEPILRKIVADDSLAKAITRATRSSTTGIRSLLTTPLLVTLLAIVYRTSQSVPDSIADFYNKLFEIVFLRHDQTKAGFKRRLASGLGEFQARKLFEAFCFSCLARSTSVLSAAGFAECTKVAIQYTSIDVDGEAFRHDMVSVAGLLHQEGLRYHFIHKSVVEFFAASFVANSSEEFGRDFYKKLATVYFEWRQVASFLQQIDKYKFAKFLGIRAIEEWSNQLQVADEVLRDAPATSATGRRILRSWAIFAHLKVSAQSVYLVGIQYIDPSKPTSRISFANVLIDDLVNRPFSDLLSKLVSSNHYKLFAKILKGDIAITRSEKRRDPAEGVTEQELITIDVCAVLASFFDESAMGEWVSTGLQEIRSHYRDFRHAVTVEERKSGMLELVTRRH